MNQTIVELLHKFSFKQQQPSSCDDVHHHHQLTKSNSLKLLIVLGRLATLEKSRREKNH